MLRLIPAVLSLGLAFGANAMAASPSGTAADYGSLAKPGDATRTITIAAGDKSINVTRGETVTIVIADKRFSWAVDTYQNKTVFDLAEIAPKDIPVQDVKVYVAGSPLYSGS